MKLFFMFLLFCGAVSAQPVFMPPDYAMPNQKTYIDRHSIPGHTYGVKGNSTRITCTTNNPSADCGGVEHPEYYGLGTTHFGNADGPQQGGAFRVSCAISHYAFDDPIVKPFQGGASHLHTFFGNTSTDAQTNPASIRTKGRSTCAGGDLNKSGYWVPSIILSCVTGEVGCINHGLPGSRDGTVFRPNLIETYYKVQYAWDAAHTSLVRWPAAGLRMVTGDPSNKIPFAAGLFGSCLADGGNTTGQYSWNHFPSSKEIYLAAARSGETGYVTGGANQVPGYLPSPCTTFKVTVGFPICWDGVNLYLPPLIGDPTHSGHVYPTTVNGACPTAFPQGIPAVSYNIFYPNIDRADWDYLVYSSDPSPDRGVTLSGSTTTAVKLDSSASSVDGFYNSGYLTLTSLNQRRQIVGYIGSTRTATLDSALPSAPSAGVAYLARQHGGITNHGDWVNGWDQTNTNLYGYGGSVTDYIMSNCYGLNDTARWGADGASTNFGADCHVDNLGAINRYKQPFSLSENGIYYFLK